MGTHICPRARNLLLHPLDANPRGRLGCSVWRYLWHLTLPAIALGTIPMAVIARMTRASLLEVLGEDYVRAAWAKGLGSPLGDPAPRRAQHLFRL